MYTTLVVHGCQKCVLPAGGHEEQFAVQQLLHSLTHIHRSCSEAAVSDPRLSVCTVSCSR